MLLVMVGEACHFNMAIDICVLKKNILFNNIFCLKMSFLWALFTLVKQSPCALGALNCVVKCRGGGVSASTRLVYQKKLLNILSGGLVPWKQAEGGRQRTESYSDKDDEEEETPDIFDSSDEEDGTDPSLSSVSFIWISSLCWYRSHSSACVDVEW